MADGKILIAGIGNIFLGDDGFGCAVARRLGDRPFPQGVRVADFGIRGFDLAFALTDHCEFAILIDATPQAGVPGTLYTLTPDLADDEGPNSGCIDGHRMDPVSVLRLARKLGDLCPRIVLVGCEPAQLGGDEGSMELSPVVEAAVEEACSLVQALVAEFLAEQKSIFPIEEHQHV
jgi:hydrogenase maturation protease